MNMGTILIIDGLDAATLDLLEAESRRRGVNVAIVARDVLRQALHTEGVVEYHDLDALAGTWSDADATAFSAATADFSRIDPELWK